MSHTLLVKCSNDHTKLTFARKAQHMSHYHNLFPGNYMKCKTQVAAYGRKTFAQIPSM